MVRGGEIPLSEGGDGVPRLEPGKSGLLCCTLLLPGVFISAGPVSHSFLEFITALFIYHSFIYRFSGVFVCFVVLFSIRLQDLEFFFFITSDGKCQDAGAWWD